MNDKKQLLKTYRNGNYIVRIYADGTKVRIGKIDLQPEFPENIDLKITSYCDGGCPMCHENSTPDGKHANLNLPFFDTLHAGTELAIGGGNPLAHPELDDFLRRMKRQGVICNITVRQTHLFDNADFVQGLIDDKLLYGVGVSLTRVDDNLIEFCTRNKNAVIHLIAGIHGQKELEALADKNLKVLWLGYKRFGRGADFYDERVEGKIAELKHVFYDYVNRFEAVSLDNAAAETLDVRHNVTEEEFRRHYMGAEGSFTMYVDAVERKFAPNSVTPKGLRRDLQDDITTMFAEVCRNRLQ